MELSNNFIKAVNERDIKMIQAVINNSFVTDPTTEAVQKMLRITKDKNIDIFEPHDNKKLEKEKSHWTRDYEKQLLSDLFFNFSRERIALLLEIVPYVERDYIEQQKVKQKSNRAVRTTRPSYGGAATRRGPVTYKKNSSPLPYVSIGGAVVAAIGWVTSSTVVTVVGGALCIGGAIGYIMTKK